LRSARVAVLRKSERAPFLIEEVFLLETDPQVRVVLDRRARVGGMRGAIRGMTSPRTIYAFLRLASGYRATGFSTQSELLPSACMVELPSKPQLGRAARVGGCSNSLSRVLPRRPGTGRLPSSQMYSSLYFVMVCGGTVSSAAPFLQLHRDPFRASVVRSTRRGCGMPGAGSNMRAGLGTLNVKDSGRVLPEEDAAIRQKCSAIILIPHKCLFMADSGPRMIRPACGG
jgi:hypothetical protein